GLPRPRRAAPGRSPWRRGRARPGRAWRSEPGSVARSFFFRVPVYPRRELERERLPGAAAMGDPVLLVARHLGERAPGASRDEEGVPAKAAAAPRRARDRAGGFAAAGD